MPLRLAEIIVPPDGAETAEKRLGELDADVVARVSLDDGRVRLETLCSADETEAILDALEDEFGGHEGFRVVLVAVEAVLPRPTPVSPEETEDKADEGEGEAEEEVAESQEEARRSTLRVYREEVYGTLNDAAAWSGVYVSTLLLSTTVAAAGLIQSSTAVIIGAMVIAPLLGPSMALALGTTLGDRALILRALRTSLGGLALGLMLSIGVGLLVAPDLGVPEIAMRTEVSLTDVVIALASGAAGALAFTTGAPAALVGVMVAVALMPPLVVFGMVLATGDLLTASGAGLLLFTNVISVNLAATIVFRLQGLTPRQWWQSAQAGRVTAIATAIWAVLLAGLIALILIAGRG